MAQEFKLKDITTLSNLQNCDKQEAEVEGIDGGKVLVVKVNDQVHALNANCTHFGAPLKNGVVSPEGRITCPWHGAPDHLHRFDVVEKDGAVYIKGSAENVKAGRRKPTFNVKSSGSEKVVIVGGGSGTFGAVQKLREHGFNGSITVISNEGLPIDRTKLSKALITDPSKVHIRDEQWYKDADIAFAKDTATSIDFKSKSVSTKSGSSYPYTKLILASGGTPKSLPLPGFKDQSNIFLLRHITDTRAIMDAVGDKGKKIVVIGSSYIGMEVANYLCKENDVTVVGMESTPLERVMGSKVGSIFQRIVEKNGVKFYMGASVDSAVPKSQLANAVGLSSVGGVKLKDGTVLDADLVILGVGVQPGTEYLKDNNDIQLEEDGSVGVDENFAVKGMKDVYALGDIATYPYHGPGGNGKPVRIEHWNVAQNMGRSVGQRIAKPDQEQHPFVPVFWSALGSQLRYCGHTPDGFDDVIVTGEPDADQPKFVAFYTKGEDVVAVASMSKDPAMTKAAELMRAGKMLTRSDLKSGKDLLQANL
ncbi:Apoptosis-inducing factor 1 [Lithohypha guttulata]|uniref:Apoptosis-inducing factor 1 n=1 Tax=Lithohypha guttulata TaxID=1690604 RepID=UPI002DDFE0A7|nr:Apoptosis-inducing factor 1 [Lithohypha guttulata]